MGDLGWRLQGGGSWAGLRWAGEAVKKLIDGQVKV
jgi:hypothetical protein